MNMNVSFINPNKWPRITLTISIFSTYGAFCMKLLVKINDYIFSKDIAEANAVDPYGAFA